MSKIAENSKALFNTASTQQGFFTTRQAQQAGYSQKNHAYHVKSGSWLREIRGIYRLAQFPLAQDADLVKWSLWSADRQGRVQGCYSHQSALRIHDFTDLNPSRLDMTVSPGFRRSTLTPKILRLHKATIVERDVEQRQGFQVTKVRRTLEDLIEEKTVGDDVVEQAVKEALNRGSLRLKEVTQSPLLNKFVRKARRVVAGRV